MNPRKPRNARGPRTVEDRHDPRSERPRHQSGADAILAKSQSATTYIAVSEPHLAVSDGTTHNALDPAIRSGDTPRNTRRNRAQRTGPCNTQRRHHNYGVTPQWRIGPRDGARCTRGGVAHGLTSREPILRPVAIEYQKSGTTRANPGVVNYAEPGSFVCRDACERLSRLLESTSGDLVLIVSCPGTFIERDLPSMNARPDRPNVGQQTVVPIAPRRREAAVYIQYLSASRRWNGNGCTVVRREPDLTICHWRASPPRNDFGGWSPRASPGFVWVLGAQGMRVSQHVYSF
ncbi:hypothetical protein B0H10DRAFT_2051429 [Mycena sp. CBHHK59/15]|nr:hypothetical protein B0H10DRAFT_2051429 [Mycena sp. CBHHK59/15]